MSIPNASGRGSRVLLLGGTSEIGLAILSALDLAPGTEVILAGRDPQRLEAAGKILNRPVTVARYDAMDTGSHQAFAGQVCAAGVPDLVIAATGILIPQEQAEHDVSRAATMIETNFTGHVTGLDAFGRGFADELHGTGVRLLLVRPGFVIGRMTEGMTTAPLATTPEAVGTAVAAALRGKKSTVWVPASLAGLATMMRLVPRPLWRKLER